MDTYRSIYCHGLVRVGGVTVPVHLADPSANAAEVIRAARACHEEAVAVAVFPELTLTGYSIDDLVFSAPLLAAVRRGIDEIVAASADLFPILVFGAPLELRDRLYNCAVVVHRGRILGITPKMHLPAYSEFYEKRYFSTLDAISEVKATRWDGRLVEDSEGGEGVFPFGSFQVEASDLPGFRLAVEICEDVWVPIAPSSVAALQGATIIANLSASPATVGRTSTRHSLIAAQSLTSLAAYVYSAAGFGESSTDLAWDGETLICEVGQTLAHTTTFRPALDITVADVDVDLLVNRRRKQNTFADNAHTAEVGEPPAVVSVELAPPRHDVGVHRAIARFPFMGGVESQVDAPAEEAMAIQVSALVRRMVAINTSKLIIGVSGGLDSTLALLVAARAMDELGRPRSDILAFTMPGFGTSEKTRTNAEVLSNEVGATFSELDIRPAARAMLTAMGHPFGAGQPVYDVTFENVQAGLRTDYLFRLAGQNHGIVVGTGDLSELALGWCTFGVGDHMSHYGVNAGLPKTMIQEVLRWVISSEALGTSVTGVLSSILNTEISPELVPGSDGGGQSTEAAIGPYELQDFTLYHLLNAGFGPAKILFMQEVAWGEKYSRAEMVKWLGVFFRRFFASQYKRSTLPNGPKVMAGGSLSPRGDWRMPADALAAPWLAELEQLEANLNGLEPTPNTPEPDPSATEPDPRATKPDLRLQDEGTPEA